MTAEWSSSTILYAVVLLSVHVTQCPVSFKGLVALASLSFINGMSVPSCVVALGEGMVHLRRGLHPLRYHVLHVRRAHLLTTESDARHD